MMALIGALGLGAIGAWVVRTPADKVPAEQRRVEAKANPPVTPAPREKETERPATPSQSLLVPKLSGSDLRWVRQELETADPMKTLAELAVTACGLDGSTVRSVKVEGDLATLDFAPEVESGFGSAQESLLLDALRKGFGQFREVRRVQITVSGERVESLGGHLEVFDPISVIRPGEQGSTMPSEEQP
jgi:hypothetical protein